MQLEFAMRHINATCVSKVKVCGRSARTREDKKKRRIDVK